MTIEDALRQHAAKFKLSLTLVRVPDGRYQASLLNGTNTFRVEIDTDPARALLRVLGLASGAAAPPTNGVFD